MTCVFERLGLPASNTRAKNRGMTWHPEDHTTGLRIIDTHPLPPGIAGLTDGTTIWLSPDLTPAGRRCTLAHELVHIERGIHPDLPGPLAAREESTVEMTAARRLVPLDQLIDAILWAQGDGDHAGLASDLDVDQSVVEFRLAAVTPEEEAQIQRALAALEQIP